MSNIKIFFAFAITIILILSASIVSASVIGDFFKKLIGGDAGITGNPILPPPSDYYSEFSGRLVSLYRFQENSYSGAAGEVSDSIDSNHGTTANGVVSSMYGIDNRSGIFDGYNDVVKFNALGTPATDNFAYSAWVKPSEYPSGVYKFIIQNGFDNCAYGTGVGFGIGSGTGNGVGRFEGVF